MNRFSLHETALQPELLRKELQDPACGGYAAFEGWVRDFNDGRAVLRLEYEGFAPLAGRGDWDSATAHADAAPCPPTRSDSSISVSAFTQRSHTVG